MMIQRMKKQMMLASGLLAMAVAPIQTSVASNHGQIVDEQVIFKQVPLQFIAALGDPEASSGGGAQSWGLWIKDPGPRGVRLKNFDELTDAGGIAPAQWKFDSGDWWLEENGLIMEQPDFPVPPGKYIVTGDREVMSMLTIHPSDENGERRWELNRGAKLYDVTHLPCRSARYTPANGESSCSPANADRTAFRVKPGSPMPFVEGCTKVDYAVLFIVAVAEDN